VGGFIRGQLLVAAIVGALAIVLLEGLHVPYPILIGVQAGALEIVPYLGAVVGAVLASGVALVSSGWEASLFVIAGFALINQIEGHLIYPFVLSGSVGLSPLLVIFALLVGGELFGIPGLVVAVPVAAIVKVPLANLLPQREPLELEPTLRRARRLTRASALAKLLARAKARTSKN
jgi:predicted PurR-regulated permease PerM